MRRFIIAIPLLLAAPPADAGSFTALASYYGGGKHGEYLNARTATGERFRASGMTAASPHLPFGTRLLVSLGGRSVVVRVNDRGPNARLHRDLDLSFGAARAIGLVKRGVAHVTVAILLD